MKIQCFSLLKTWRRLCLILALTAVVAEGRLGATSTDSSIDLRRFPEWPAAVRDVRVVRLSNGRTIHRFFDTSPISPSGRYVALFRFPREDGPPRAGETGDVILVDLETGQERVVAQSRGYEMQVGANVQWGKTDHELYFNDVDPAAWRAFAVQLDPLTGSLRRLGGTVFMVSPDGTRLASHNLITSRRAQVGYGVVVPDGEMPPRVGGPTDADGITITDVLTGGSRLIASTRQIYEKTVPSIKIPHPEDYQYFCFQAKWNPQGTRLMTSVQWAPLHGGKRRRAVITMRPDGSDLRTAVTPEQWGRGGHHMNWMPDGEHLSMNLNVEGGRGLAIIRVSADGTGMSVLFRPGSGHPSQQPRGLPFYVTDAYPDEPVAAGDGTSPLRFLDIARGVERTILQIYVSMTAGEMRVDPHPAWDRTGRYVAFNGFVGGTRNVFLADLGPLLEPAGPTPPPGGLPRPPAP